MLEFIAEKLNLVHLLTTEGLGHKKILRDKAIIGNIPKYMFDQKNMPEIGNALDLTLNIL
jgi:hypothetical protein